MIFSICETAQAGLKRILPLALLLAALAGCSSESGGNNPIFGTGERPDPGTEDFAVAYVKRTLPPPQQQLRQDARELRVVNVDADLYMRDRASPSAQERNITARVTGEADGDENRWDVKDVDASFDGRKVIFAMRGPMIPNADEEDQPTWNVWEYNLDTDTLRRVIPSDITAEEGHDVSPHYLPDGRIVFSSTRQRQSKAILLDEGKPQFEAQDEDRNEPAFVLHVMNADGSDLHQISFNQSHDLDPTVMADGRILFTRWDHAPGKNGMSLYTVNPDGQRLELLFGANSHRSTDSDGSPIEIQFLQPRLLEDGHVLTLLRPFTGTNFGADIGGIDTVNYVENTQPTLPNRGILSGPAIEDVVINDVRETGTAPSPGGVFSAAFPILDGTDRLFVSWSLCRALVDGHAVPCTDDVLDDPDALAAAPFYGIWIYDRKTDTQQPVVPPEEGMMITDVVALKPRILPAVILDAVPGVDLDQNLVNENVGVLHIRSVYDFDGTDTAPGGITVLRNPAVTTARQRPARFVRIEKAVSIPDRNVRDFRNSAFGTTNYMREIIGYAPVEPDGSVRVKVPANVAFAISFVDADGQRFSPRHNNWLQVRPGEVLECNGCHNPNTGESHGRRNLFASANPGAPATGQPFPNTNAALSLVDAGDTMAQVRGRVMCNGACPPSVDVLFDDLWPAASITPVPSFDFCYSTGPTDAATDPANPSGTAAPRHTCTSSLRTAAPAPPACERQWSSGCRVVINYETHIHPLWGIDRTVDANNDGMPDTDGMGNPIDHKCIGCHSPLDAMNAARVPAGQLDLSDGASDQNPDHFKAYRELLFTDQRQTLNMGALVDDCSQTDPNTGLCVTFFNVNPSMVAGSARASTRFFNPFFYGGGTVDHRGFLSPAELRLIAEWLDIGAQYYNNPFDAPLN